MNKAMGVIIIILALVVGIVPLFTDCLSQGRILTTTTGTTVPMKCHWTSIAEIGMAVPLLLMGVLTLFSKRKETINTLSLFGLTLGALVILFPTVLIGVCANPMMVCNMIEKPVLILSGILVIAATGVSFASSRKMVEMTA